METITFQIKSSEKCLFGFNRSDFVVKTDFLRWTVVNYLLVTATCKLISESI